MVYCILVILIKNEGIFLYYLILFSIKNIHQKNFKITKEIYYYINFIIRLTKFTK